MEAQHTAPAATTLSTLDVVLALVVMRVVEAIQELGKGVEIRSVSAGSGGDYEAEIVAFCAKSGNELVVHVSDDVADFSLSGSRYCVAEPTDRTRLVHESFRGEPTDDDIRSFLRRVCKARMYSALR